MSERGGGIHFPLGRPASPSGEAPALPPTSKRLIDPSRLERPLDSLRGVGRTRSAALAALGLRSLADLLERIPFRHENPVRLAKVAELRIGEEATVRATVKTIAVRPTRRRGLKVLEALVADESGTVRAVWYNQAYLADAFSNGPEVLLKGSLRRYGTLLSFVVTSHELLSSGEPSEGIHTLGLIPVYPASGDVSVRFIRSLLGSCRDEAQHVVDPLPSRVVASHRFPGRRDALLSSHFPASISEARASRKRLAFEELLLLQLALQKHRREEESDRPAVALPAPGTLAARFLRDLPFAPTGAQTRVMADVDRDLARAIPMRRLLQGDVGSGKTAVAAYSLVRAVEAGGQGAVMVPTEVLADQHAVRLGEQFGALGIRVALLKGSTRAAARRDTVRRLAAGEPMVVVGTHSLIQDQVAFGALRVVVVDEQHRFGVRQRAALFTPSGDDSWPHALHMTATPIPRTLCLTLYGDLDVSVIDELPPGRTPVLTRLFYDDNRDDLWSFVRARLDEGRQAFVVCPLIDDNVAVTAASASETFRSLTGGPLASYRLGLVHGRLKSEHKSEVMAAFSAGGLDALVTTTVIEVGVDVPNATVMVVEDAHRFGISQLHQLRGRVGRGAERGYCLIGADSAEGEARERLETFARTNDGFALAEADLRARGEGQVFGERQTGWGDLKVARVLRDQKILALARRTATSLLEGDPELSSPQNRLLADAAQVRFGGLTSWLDNV
ncbi:MAG: ATP-dependent DNA helicase RecG [Actinobacteria bacterium]|nr:ATP-dependent DNA helicase RecG [Actinomycetota bacterium]